MLHENEFNFIFHPATTYTALQSKVSNDTEMAKADSGIQDPTATGFVLMNLHGIPVGHLDGLLNHISAVP